MKMKKLTALLLAGVMAASLVGCGNDGKADQGAATNEPAETNDAADATDDAGNAEVEVATGLEGKLVIWTLAQDLVDFGEKFQEINPDVEVETVIIAPADYPTKLSAALRGKAKEPDIIVGEPQMLPEFFEAGYFEDLSQDPYNADQYKDKLVDYIFEAGRSEDGSVRALSYQVTPVGIYYRRDIAQDVFGTDDPDAISEKFSSFAAIEETARELKNKGYRIFGDTGNLRWFANGGGAWVQNDELILSEERIAYMDAAATLFQEGLVAFSPEWSAAWYKSMSGVIPLNAEWASEEELAEASGDTTEVFSYALPSWGSLIVRDNAGDNAGSFGVAEGPAAGFGGGTFIGISAHSQKKDLAWEFVKFATLDEGTSEWWSDYSKGDVVSMKSTLEDLKDKENDTYGNQKTYAYFLEQANNIDYSLITKYDTGIGDFWGAAIEAVQKGEKSKEDAIADFYKQVQSVYPELKLPE